MLSLLTISNLCSRREVSTWGRGVETKTKNNKTTKQKNPQTKNPPTHTQKQTTFDMFFSVYYTCLLDEEMIEIIV